MGRFKRQRTFIGGGRPIGPWLQRKFERQKWHRVLVWHYDKTYRTGFGSRGDVCGDISLRGRQGQGLLHDLGEQREQDGLFEDVREAQFVRRAESEDGCDRVQM